MSSRRLQGVQSDEIELLTKSPVEEHSVSTIERPSVGTSRTFPKGSVKILNQGKEYSHVDLESISEKEKRHEYIESMKSNFIVEELPNVSDYKWLELRFDISILPRIIMPTLFFTVWSAIWTTLYMIYNLTFLGVWIGLVMVASVVISLLLVFRTNTAYERYVRHVL
jgi:hypothetical protein